MKIFITGGTGKLGFALKEVLSSKTHYVVAPPRKEFDITKRKEVIKKLVETNPDVVIHTAALTSVDECELDKNKAFNINVLGTLNVVEATKIIGAKFVYISTDYVFDGEKFYPYHEWEPENPVNYYGVTKYQGERIVMAKLTKAFVVRTAWLYGSKTKPDFVEVVLSQISKQNLPKFTKDHIGSPSYTKDVALAIANLISTEYYGIYHIVNRGEATRLDFAREILKIKGIQKRIDGTTGDRIGFVAKRPYYSVLSPQLFETIFSYKFRDWQDALRDYLTHSCKD